jgi:hypothetical protein
MHTRSATRRAYAAYAALQNTHDQPTQNIMQLPLSRFHDLKKNDAHMNILNIPLIVISGINPRVNQVISSLVL